MKYTYIDSNGELHVVTDGEDDRWRLLSHPSQAPLFDRLKGVIGERRVEVLSLNRLGARGRVPQCEIPSYMHAADDEGWRVVQSEEVDALDMSAHFGVCECPEQCVQLRLSTLKHPAVRGGACFTTKGTASPAFMAVLHELYDIHRFGERPLTDEAWEPPAGMLEFMGLDDMLALGRFIINDEIPAHARGERAVSALLSWSAYDSSESVNPEEGPYGFLHRYQQEQTRRLGRYGNEEALVTGCWYTTRYFLGLLYDMWRSGLSGDKAEGSRFFVEDEEVAAFERHIEEINMRLDNL